MGHMAENPMTGVELTIECWYCADCRLRDLSTAEKDRHEQLTDHELIPEYV